MKSTNQSINNNSKNTPQPLNPKPAQGKAYEGGLGALKVKTETQQFDTWVRTPTTPDTLHPQLSTLNPTPYTLHRAPDTLHHELSTLNPTPYIQPRMQRDGTFCRCACAIGTPRSRGGAASARASSAASTSRYRGYSKLRTHAALGPYSRLMPRALW